MYYYSISDLVYNLQLDIFISLKINKGMDRESFDVDHYTNTYYFENLSYILFLSLASL